MKSLIIKRAGSEDLDQLIQIGRRTFFDSFASDNTEENMKAYLAKAFSSEKIRSELLDKNSEFYFAILDEKEIGYLKINFGISQTHDKEEDSLEIERIYVLEEYHGKNVGQQLHEQAIAVAKQNEVRYIWLGVWEENPRAIRFYKKNGFVEFDTHVFMLGDDKQTDILMKLQLE